MLSDTKAKAVEYLHDLAKTHADKADQYQREVKLFPAVYQRYLAHCLSTTAASIVADELDYEPSRSILYLSAASMAMQAQEYEAAAQLALDGASVSTPERLFDELLDLRSKAIELTRNGA